MKKPTLYVTDLDGTLLTPDRAVTPFTTNTINRLVERGMLFTYATARSLSSAGMLTAGLHLELPVILNNGVSLSDGATGEVLELCSFGPDTLDGIFGILEEEGIQALAYSRLDGAERVSWVTGGENPGVAAYVAERQGWDARLRPVDSREGLRQGEIFYFTIIEERERAEEVRERLSRLPGIGLYLTQDIYTRSEWWVEVCRADASKAAAIEKLRRRTGAGKVVCFGDGPNDLPMFRSCDEAYAMANALPEVKAAATAVIGSNEEDGVARWLLEHGTF